jgi:hypothetical protein
MVWSLFKNQGRENPKDVEHVNGSKLIPGKPRSRWEQTRKMLQRRKEEGEDLGSDRCGGLTGRWFT